MSTTGPLPRQLSETQRMALASLLGEFSRGWHEQLLEQQVRRLPPADSPLRRLALVEMVKIDLERQWQQGRRPRLEAYLHFYPELGTADTAPPELVLAEFQARRQFGGTADLADYENRFPRLAPRLRQLLGRPPADSRAGGPPSSSLPGPNSLPLPAGGDTLPGPSLGPSTLSWEDHPTAARSVPPAAPSPERHDLPNPFGEYRIERKLSQGGMGSVYLAYDPELERRVALKVPLLGHADAESLERFKTEARALARFNDRHICQVYKLGKAPDRSGQDRYYMAMEYVEGQPLSEVARARPLTPRQAVELVRTLARALQRVHECGVIHRDLKPTNVMMRHGEEPVVVDFGLARRSNPGAAGMTQPGALLGTPAYMAPEQVIGDVAAMGPATDVYGLGVILYELLTGQPPYRGSLSELWKQVLTREPEPPSRVRAGLDSSLDAICHKAMAREVADRYATMADFAAALEGYLGRAAGPPELPPHLAPRRRLPWRAWAAIAGTLMLVALAAAVVIYVRTDYGTIRIELNDPRAKVEVDGKEVSIKELGEPITLRAGTHGLTVKRGELVVETRSFKVQRGTNEPLRVTFTAEPAKVAKAPLPGTESPSPKFDPPPKVDPRPKVEPPPGSEPGLRPPAKGWVRLFNGKDLDGWRTEGGYTGQWAVEDGAIVGRSRDYRTRGYLLTDKEYGDYVLRVEFKIDSGNHGVAIRANEEEKVPYRGRLVFEHPIIKLNVPSTDKSQPTGTARWVKSDDPTALPVNVLDLPAEDWHTMELTVRGNTCTATINGKRLVDLTLDPSPGLRTFVPGLARTRGRIGLQNNTGTVRYRNIDVKELPPKKPDTSGPKPLAPGFVALFNGKDLEGWETDPTQPGDWRVEDGVLVGRGSKTNHLFTKRYDFTDFHLIAEARINDGGNSGVYGRAAMIERRTFPPGYEAQINSTGRDPSRTGSLYVNNVRSTCPVRVAERLVEPGEWFRLELIVRGERIIIKVNGKTTADYVDSSFARGRIALQQHDGKSVPEFRRVEVKDLASSPPDAPRPKPATPGYAPLFNGKDLTGWKTPPSQPGHWRVEDGILKGSGAEHSHLFTERADFTDFHLRVEVRINEGGNSGLYFRAPFGVTRGGKYPEGYEAQIYLTDEGTNRTGSLLAAGKRVSDSDVVLKPGEWFDMEVIARGNHIVVKVNGKIVTDYTDSEKTSTRGCIALQQMDPKTEVEFRKIEVRDLPPD